MKLKSVLTAGLVAVALCLVATTSQAQGGSRPVNIAHGDGSVRPLTDLLYGILSDMGTRSSGEVFGDDD
jgi:hypothetical protein